MLQVATIAPGTLGLLKRIQALPELKKMRLVGGTALALLLGHRKSVDLDFFGEWDKRLDLLKLLSTVCDNALALSKSTHGNLQFFLMDNVKVDIVNLPHEWLSPPVEEEGLRLASLRDIAAMKLEAINNRGLKRDFVDLAVLLEHFTLSEMLDFYKQKYADPTPFSVLRSLAYFLDAEKEDMPVMLVSLTWEQTKKRIQDALQKITNKPL